MPENEPNTDGPGSGGESGTVDQQMCRDYGKHRDYSQSWMSRRENPGRHATSTHVSTHLDHTISSDDNTDIF